MLTPDLPSICIRLANLAAAIAGRLDGTVAIGEQDLCIVSLLMMAHREDGESLFRVLMADVGHWISVRKGSRPALLVVDEFSAVSGARAGAIDVMERGRSFGVPSPSQRPELRQPRQPRGRPHRLGRRHRRPVRLQHA